MKYALWLMNLKGIPNSIKCELAHCFSSAEEVYFATESTLKELVFLQETHRQILLTNKDGIEEAYQDFLKTGMSFVCAFDEAYPQRFIYIHDAPFGFYTLGNFPGDLEKVVAIVGARSCSAYGQKMAYELGYELARRGHIVVSGMAKGIDVAAHRGCMSADGTTIAVLGCGADVCYPRQNINDYMQIQEDGCIISEYPPGAPPLAQQFPSRNRMISGLAKQVIVVEAREKSGSLITMEYALEQGKDIYAVPGRITDPLSVGCNQMIEQGAGIITSVRHFVNSIDDFSQVDLQNTVESNRTQLLLEKEEMLVYSCFDFYPKSINVVAEETQIDFLKLLSAVMNLCEKGYIKEVTRNEYVRLV